MMPDDEIIVGSSGRYHKVDCHHANRVWKRNRESYTALKSASFEAALDGLSPCGSCNPPYDPYWDNLARDLDVIRRLENIDVVVMRRMAADMLDRRFGSDVPKRSLKARVIELSRQGSIPADVTNCLHMISDLRNMAEHEGELTQLQRLIARLCWALVVKWSATRT
jgi:Domain of unknown function (DUF4145)